MEIEEWKPAPPGPYTPPAPPVSNGRVILGYSLAGVGAFLVTLAVMSRHEIAQYMAAQHSAKSEPLRLAQAQAIPPHVVAAQDLRPLPPAALPQVNPTPPPHFGPRPLPKERPAQIPPPAEPAHDRAYP
jgi:hypothetical protein